MTILPFPAKLKFADVDPIWILPISLPDGFHTWTPSPHPAYTLPQESQLTPIQNMRISLDSDSIHLQLAANHYGSQCTEDQTAIFEDTTCTYHRVHQSWHRQIACGSQMCRHPLHHTGSCIKFSISLWFHNQHGNTYTEAGRVKLCPKKPLSVPVSVTYAWSPSGEKAIPGSKSV